MAAEKGDANDDDTDDARNERPAEDRRISRTGCVVRSFTDQTRVTLDGEVVCLSGNELDRLLAALAALDCRDAAAVAGEIAAPRVAGGTIGLMPTEAEQDALRLALEGLAATRGESVGGLAALAAVWTEGGSTLGAGAT